MSRRKLPLGILIAVSLLLGHLFNSSRIFSEPAVRYYNIGPQMASFMRLIPSPYLRWSLGQQSADGLTFSSPPNAPQVVSFTASGTITAATVIAVCDSAASGNVVLTINAAASGSHRPITFINRSATYSCSIATSNGTDTIDGATANYVIGAGIQVPYKIFDFASGVWLAMSPLTVNQAWAAITGNADVTIGSSPTLIESVAITAPSSINSDMCSVGQIEYTNSSGSNGTMIVYVGLWMTSGGVYSTAACPLDYYLGTGQTPNTICYLCCNYQAAPTRGNLYYNKVWASTSLTIVTAKYQSTLASGYATNVAPWIAPSF
jgi:hypothetical protein